MENKNNHLKRILLVLISALLIFSSVFSGCSSNGSKMVSTTSKNPGEITYDITPEENIISDDNGLSYYSNNELLITTKDNIKKAEVEKLAKDYDAEIVGYIEITGDYQWRFNKEYSKNELERIGEELRNNELIYDVSINYLSKQSLNAKFNPNDSHWSNEWDNNWPASGLNWGAEAVHANHIWSLKDKMTPINVGLIDWEFDTKHEDLDFAEVFFNPKSVSDSHGTHVAGTMAAGMNNKVGIAGIYPFGEKENSNGAHLYGVSYNGAVNNQGYASDFFWKIAFSELILRNVKVINVSMGYADELFMFLAAKGYTDVQNECKRMSKSLGDFLERLLDKGYDFVIVSAAGNSGEAHFKQKKETDSYPYGWEIVKRGGETNQNMADWGSQINAITNKTVMERIIVVGAASLNKKLSKEGNYFSKCGFSSDGSRVDIYAPGKDVSSCVINNSYEDDWQGTSMASPHVAGVVADVWSYNTTLSGKRVKEIVIKSGDYLNNSSRGIDGTNKKMVSALYAVSDASDEFDNQKAINADNGMIAAHVFNPKDGSNNNSESGIKGAEIEIYKASNNELVDKQVTDENGYFESLLLPDNYYLLVKATGYDENRIENINILKGQIHYDYIIMNESITDFTIPKDMVLTLGEINSIEPETVPADATGYSIKWTSSDESVATVTPTGEECIVTSKGKGTATITGELVSNGKTITKSTNIRVASQGRDTVLVLDVSGSMSGTPIDEMKKSAINFCNELLADEYNNRVGLVLYDDYIDTVDLTNDLDSLINYIKSISSGGTTNMQGALAAAGNMLDSQGKDDNIKNVVIMADGLPNEGETSDTGKMSQLTQYSSYSGDVAYANGVINTAENIMSNYNMYSLGFFHDLSGVEKDFAVDLMKFLTNMPDGYHQVDTAENLQFAFGDIQETISDGSKVVINIACPVDVSVTYNGETLSSAQSTYSDIASFGTLQLLGKNKDIKVLSLDPSVVYDIQLNGTGSGTMNYSVNYLDDSDAIIDYRTFESIPITPTTKIDSNTNNSAGEISLNLDEDGDGTVDKVYSAAVNSVAELTYGAEPQEPEVVEEVVPEKSDDTWITVMIAVVVVIVLVGIILTAVLVSSSNKKKNQSYNIPVIEPKNDAENKGGKITVISGSMSGKEFNLDTGKGYIIGKDSSKSQIVLAYDYGKVSREHCVISYDDQTQLYSVIDMSSNGTYYIDNKTAPLNSSVSKHRLNKNVGVELQNGCVLVLGDEDCRIVLN